MTHDVNLQWKSFNVDLNTVDAWLKANVGANYCGLSANNQLQIHFSVNPGDLVASEIGYYWSHLIHSSPEALNYMCQADRTAAAAANRAAKIANATAKLEAIGLSVDEIKALLGQ